MIPAVLINADSLIRGDGGAIHLDTMPFCFLLIYPARMLSEMPIQTTASQVLGSNLVKNALLLYLCFKGAFIAL